LTPAQKSGDDHNGKHPRQQHPVDKDIDAGWKPALPVKNGGICIMNKKVLQSSARVSWASVTKPSKSEPVSLKVLNKICKAIECNIGDISENEIHKRSGTIGHKI
jgi:DNA-binding Xre family transcriptional regulator